MTVSVTKSSFTGGEWSPSLHSRPELAKYDTAVKTMKNMIIHPHGPTSNRGGTQFIGDTKYHDKVSRLSPFQFSVEQSYMLEFGDQYIRVFKDGGRVVGVAQTITGMVYFSPPQMEITFSAAHGFSAGEDIYITGVVGFTGINDKYWNILSVTSSTKVVIELSTSGAYVSGGTVVGIYEIVTPYLEADLSLLKFEQSVDVLYLTHPSYAPRKLSRTGHTAWTLSTITFASGMTAPTGFSASGIGSEPSYGATAVDSDGNESVISNQDGGVAPVTCTWSAASGASYYNIYKSQNVAGAFGWIAKTSGLTYTEPTGGLNPDYAKSPPLATNPFPSADNYPGVSTFFEQRLVFLRTNNFPQTLWGSQTGNFENMDVSSPLQDDDAYEFTLNANQVNEIRWAVPLENLIIGTSGSEWRMSSGSGDSAVTPLNVNMKRQSRWGVSHVRPIVIGNTVLFIEGSGKAVRDLLYSFEVDGYAGNSLTILASHLFKNITIIEWAYQQAPDSIIWAVRSDGKLLGLTYYREHEVWGWHQHETQGFFESVANITVEAGVDEAWLIVRRTIDGTQKRFVERFKPRLPSEDVRDAYFVDAGLTYDVPLDIIGATQGDPVVILSAAHGLSNGDLVDIVDVEGETELNFNRYKIANAATNTFELQTEAGVDVDGSAYTEYTGGGVVRKAVIAFSGYGHLEGETLSVLADGNVTSAAVVDGAFTLTHAASRVHAGLSYTSELELLPFVYPVENGTTQDRIREIKSVLVQMEDSRILKIGPDEDTLVAVPFRDEERYGDPIALYSGDKEVNIFAGDIRNSRIFIKVDQPVPLTVSAVIVRMNSGER